MDGLISLLQIPSVQIIGWTLGAIGWILGIISGIVQLKSYREQKDLENAYRLVFDQAQRDWKGKYTQEQIDDLKSELIRLEQAIRKDVPRQARVVFLEDQLKALEEDIARLYSNHVSLSDELDHYGRPSNLPAQVTKAIEEKIMPNYLNQQRQQRMVYWLILILLFFTVFPFFLPLFYTNDIVRVFGSKVSIKSISLFFLIVLLITAVMNRFFKIEFQKSDLSSAFRS